MWLKVSAPRPRSLHELREHFCSPPSPRPSAWPTPTYDHGYCCHHDGPQPRVGWAVTAALTWLNPLHGSSLAKVTSNIEFAVATPTDMNRSHQLGTLTWSVSGTAPGRCRECTRNDRFFFFSYLLMKGSTNLVVAPTHKADRNRRPQRGNDAGPIPEPSERLIHVLCTWPRFNDSSRRQRHALFPVTHRSTLCNGTQDHLLGVRLDVEDLAGIVKD